MARREIPQPEPSRNGPGPWIVSFNDCMTNLLCFFVLLVSFSSFNPESRSQLTGAFRSISLDSVLPDKPSKQSLLKPPPQHFDQTEHGADIRVDADPRVTHKPRRRPFISDTSVYRDRQEITIDSNMLLLAKGTTLTHEGKQGLDSLAQLLKIKPAQVIITESGLVDSFGRPETHRSLERASVVLEYLASASQMPNGWFAIATPTNQEMLAQPVMQITLLNREIAQ